ncbi:MAG: WD40 repeat domain-containing protein [Rhodobacteraceae bacterium]|nr:WD40 repeat domain-containing protein [Paracoccaceae bacterium]
MPTIAAVEAGSFVVKTGFLNDVPYFALGDGRVAFVDGAQTDIQAHKSGLLAATELLDGSALVTSGDDGLIQKVSGDGAVETLSERPRKWIDILACGPSGAVAFASGRTAWVRLSNGEEKEFAQDRAVGGLSFAPKGMRLAVSHYDGSTLLWVNTSGTPQKLEWKGAHLGVCFSPDGKYLVTAMQENALHGWRLTDAQDMRMTGYPTKVKSWSWSVKGRYLATSGANAAICWPFFGKTGPMGQNPLQLGTRGDSLVSCVACHPKEDVLAIGYQDGMVMMCRFEDNAEVLLRRPGRSPISALAWDKDGLRVSFGAEDGEAGIISLQ